jgi:hypothetical protein
MRPRRIPGQRHPRRIEAPGGRGIGQQAQAATRSSRAPASAAPAQPVFHPDDRGAALPRQQAHDAVMRVVAAEHPAAAMAVEDDRRARRRIGAVEAEPRRPAAGRGSACSSTRCSAAGRRSRGCAPPRRRGAPRPAARPSGPAARRSRPRPWPGPRPSRDPARCRRIVSSGRPRDAMQPSGGWRRSDVLARGIPIRNVSGLCMCREGNRRRRPGAGHGALWELEGCRRVASPTDWRRHVMQSEAVRDPSRWQREGAMQAGLQESSGFGRRESWLLPARIVGAARAAGSEDGRLVAPARCCAPRSLPPTLCWSHATRGAGHPAA